jgi:cytochrome d ubiquinol oxidase subunit I
MLKGRRDAHHRLGFMVPFLFATVFALTQPLVGHVLGLRLAEHQPAKLAAFELAPHTEQPAPLTLGGIMVDGQVKYALKIPMIGSLIARNNINKPVPGLDEFPKEDLPPVNMAHIAFQGMVGLGTLLAGVVALFWLLRSRRLGGRDLLENKWFLRFSAISGGLAILALELGWIATEVGRQPWVVYGFLRTQDAATDNPYLWWSLAGTTVVYVLMGTAAYVVLRSMARRWREGAKDLPSPYGPALVDTADGGHA